jgi:hypothetical protein
VLCSVLPVGRLRPLPVPRQGNAQLTTMRRDAGGGVRSVLSKVSLELAVAPRRKAFGNPIVYVAAVNGSGPRMRARIGGTCRSYKKYPQLMKVLMNRAVAKSIDQTGA